MSLGAWAWACVCVCRRGEGGGRMAEKAFTFRLIGNQKQKTVLAVSAASSMKKQEDARAACSLMVEHWIVAPATGVRFPPRPFFYPPKKVQISCTHKGFQFSKKTSLVRLELTAFGSEDQRASIALQGLLTVRRRRRWYFLLATATEKTKKTTRCGARTRDH